LISFSGMAQQGEVNLFFYLSFKAKTVLLSLNLEGLSGGEAPATQSKKKREVAKENLIGGSCFSYRALFGCGF